MSIRREDKELIHNLAVLGALLGACLGVFAVTQVSARAREADREQSEYHQTHAALAKFGTTTGDPAAAAAVDEALLRQVKAHIQAEQPGSTQAEKSFWLDLPKWGFWGICAASGIAGAIGGFGSIWLAGWTGSVFLYYLIRGLYRLIRKVAPNSAAARSFGSPQTPQLPYAGTFPRSDNRTLPMVVKLLFLLVWVLGVLALVVWNLAGI